MGLSGNACDGYTTLQQRNNNNKLDPCLNWSSDTLDEVNTVGLGLRKEAGQAGPAGNLIFAARPLGQQRDRRQLGQQPPQRTGRGADDVRRVLRSPRRAADRQHDTTELRLSGTCARQGPVPASGLRLPAHDLRRLDL